MRTLNVKQIALKDGCKHVAIHSFPFLESLNSGFYRTLISYSAFFESIKMRNKNENHLFLVIREDEPKTAYEIERDNNLPTLYHNDLLSFFEYIGYNHKTKKYDSY